MPEDIYKATGIRRLTCSQNGPKIDTRSKHVYRSICVLTHCLAAHLVQTILDDSTEMVGWDLPMC